MRRMATKGPPPSYTETCTPLSGGHPVRDVINQDAERKAAEVRIRAERKTGELLKATKQSGERQSAGQPKKERSGDTTILSDLGISKDQSSQWQRLAEIPKKKFVSLFVALLEGKSGCGLDMLFGLTHCRSCNAECLRHLCFRDHAVRLATSRVFFFLAVSAK